jgi:hypothetical protein
MLLHCSDEENAVTKYVSEALGKGYLTVYLPLTTNNNNNNSSLVQNSIIGEYGLLPGKCESR